MSALPSVYLGALQGDLNTTPPQGALGCLLKALLSGWQEDLRVSFEETRQIEDANWRWLAISHLIQRAWLSRDTEHLVSIEKRIRGESSDDRRAELVAGYCSALADPSSLTPRALQEFEQHASKLEWSHLVVEFAALRAENAWARHDASEALRHARRATRMARTEELVLSQYFAALTLARTRRRMGRPYLAAHILRSLRANAPAPWHPRIEWELLLSSGPDTTEHSRLDEVGTALLQAAHLLRRGDITGAQTAVAGIVAGSTPESVECETLLYLLGLRDVVPESAEEFACGATHFVPHGLDAFGADSTIVCVASEGSQRRLLACAASSYGPIHASSRPGRVETAFCVLAGGAWVTRADFFEAVYGFEFDVELHKGSLEVVVHRLRLFVEGHAELERSDTQLRMRVLKTMVAPDPRCERGTSAALLRVLALPGQHSAKDLAERASIPLRTAQAALKGLVEEGAVQVLKNGRRVDYAVEDTTFRNSTTAD